MLIQALAISLIPLFGQIIPWADPSIPISEPPRLTGRQMGTVETIGVPPLGYEMDGDVKVFRLIAQPVLHTLTDGNRKKYWYVIPRAYIYKKTMRRDIEQKVETWGYNGSTPGPTIEVFEGDRVRIIVKNELPEPTSIHWHGLEVPNTQDGAAGSGEYPILPGESRAYEFTLYQHGTFLYHSGFNMPKQDGYGLAGIFVVHPKEEEEEKIDRDFAILLQEWSILPGSQSPNLLTMDFNWFTFNGHAAPSIPLMKVKQGERVRIRIGNLSMSSHPIHIHGYSWEVVGTEGGEIPKSARWPGATINVAPGETRDVEFVAWNPGIWRFHCHKLHHIMNAHAEVPMGVMPHGGMFTYVYVVPTDPSAPWQHPTAAESDEPLAETGEPDEES